MPGSEVQVFVRVRGLNARETAAGDADAWALQDGSLSEVGGAHEYQFDRVFAPQQSTRDLYDAAVAPLVEHALRGFNATVFAYGQTGSGKTYTVMGSSEQPGVLPLAVQDVFDHIAEAPDRTWVLQLQYLEIYNEIIKDLLAPEKTRLEIHESATGGPVVSEAQSVAVSSTEQVLEVLATGESHRHVANTRMNATSSRSHTLFRLAIECADAAEGVNRASVLYLIDLAGSERQSKTGAQGARLREGAAINRSLMVLGTVISKLSEGKQQFVPYRDSKLTRLLSSSLGGNAHTAVIGAVSPASSNVSETVNTLDFCRRAKLVVNHARCNAVEDAESVIARYKREVEELRRRLSAAPPPRPPTPEAALRDELEASRTHEAELEQKLQGLETLLLQPSADPPAVAPRRRRLSVAAHGTLQALDDMRTHVGLLEAIEQLPSAPSAEGGSLECLGEEEGEGEGEGAEVQALRAQLAEYQDLEKSWHREREVLLQAAQDAQRREREANERLADMSAPLATDCLSRWLQARPASIFL